LGPFPKQFSLRLWNGPLALSGDPADPGYDREISYVQEHFDLIGFVGSAPEAHQTSNGTAVTNLSLATKTSWKKEDGSYASALGKSVLPGQLHRHSSELQRRNQHGDRRRNSGPSGWKIRFLLDTEHRQRNRGPLWPSAGPSKPGAASLREVTP
jgi:hypothetical protein